MTMTADFKQAATLVGKILAGGQIAAATTNTTIYTVPALSATKVATGALMNVSAATVTVSVSVVPSGGAVDGTHKILTATLAAGDLDHAARNHRSLPRRGGIHLRVCLGCDRD